MNKITVNKLTKLAIFLTLSIVLSYFESFIPLPIPGVKLGLANIAGLLVLYIFSIKEFLLIGITRVLVVGLLRGSLTSFLFSLSGFILSSIVVILFYVLQKGSIFGLSISSACFHIIGQIIVCAILYSNILIINYLPILLLTSIASGLIVALFVSVILKRLGNILMNKDGEALNENENEKI